MKKVFKFDTVLALVVLFLLLFGLIMITSIGVPKSISLSAPDVLYPNCSDANVDCYLLFKKHLVRLFMGLGAFFLAYKLPLKFWKKVSPVMYGATLILLIFVAASGSSYGTIAQSWLVLFDKLSIQPSEFAKISIIIYLSYWLAKKGRSIESFGDGFVPFAVIAGLMIMPVVLQNDFGSVMVLGLICLAMYLVAGAKLKHIGIAIGVALMAAVVVATTIPHVRERFQGFMTVDEECLEDYCWQSQQANIAIGTGGFWGKGLTQGVQKSYWLPQASDDFIFAASAEELGFFRIIFVVVAYFLLAVRGYQIAGRAPNAFQMFLATGITTWITMQAFINIAVNTALAPVTGITLPFISYGGSSLVSSLVGIGILLKISENTSTYASSGNRWRNRRTRRPKYSRYRRA